MFVRRLCRALYRAAQLACPRCGQRTLFRGTFAMHERCAVCNLVFEREPGYFVGAIYINYAFTAVIAVAGFLLLDLYVEPSLTTQLVLWFAFGIGFPLFFYRYSKALWLAIDHLFSPEEPELRAVAGRRV